MVASDRKAEQEPRGAYEAALAAALDDFDQAKTAANSVRESLTSAEARLAEIARLIRNLVAMVPPHRAALYTQRVHALGSPAQPSHRAGPVHDNVIDLFARTRRRDWSASEVQAALAQDGKQADAKAVYNVLGYLARRGRLQRFARGRYLVVDLGVGIQLDDDLEGVGETGGGCSED